MDEQEFTAWAVGVERRLLRSAYLLTGDLHRAEDLVQEALVKVAMRWDRLREGNPTAYARTILVRDQISWWRRRREIPVEEVAGGAAVSSDPDVAMVVRRALQRLTAAQRAVVVLRHFDDLSVEETAAILRVAPGTVKSQNAAALAASDARVAKEAASRAAYQAGELSLDRNKLRPVLAELGVRYLTEGEFLGE